MDQIETTAIIEDEVIDRQQDDEQIVYKDSTYEIASKVAYLIGVPQRIFEK